MACKLLIVVDQYGERIHLGKAIIRNFGKTLSAIPFGLGFLWIALHKSNRSWHGMISKTYVVPRNK